MTSPSSPSAETLLPCPFCGETATASIRESGAYRDAIVVCDGCEADISTTDAWLTPDEDARGLSDAITAWNRRAPTQIKAGESFQDRVQPWMLACFGAEISGDKVERGDRLLEEVLELLQSNDYDPARVLALRDYVWSRPAGEPFQEVGGVQVTLAAYCLAHALDMHEAGETELARIWTKVDKIRAKQAAKPVGSALPIALSPKPGETIGEALDTGRFLVERLEDFERADFDDEEWFREYSGHVAPAVARFKAALSAPPKGNAEGVKAPQWFRDQQKQIKSDREFEDDLSGNAGLRGAAAEASEKLKSVASVRIPSPISGEVAEALRKAIDEFSEKARDLRDDDATRRGRAYAADLLRRVLRDLATQPTTQPEGDGK